MENKVSPVVTSSFPVMALLGAVLVVLKLLGKITISWLWVLAPFWIPWLIAIAFLMLFALVGLLALLLSK